MTTLTETARNGQWLKWLAENRFCLEVGLMDQNNAVSGGAAALYKGDVLRAGGGSDYIAVDATTGADATAILLEDMTAAENAIATTKKLVLVRGPAVIDSDHLVFTESATQKAAALTALEALDIVAVNSALADWEAQTL